jgi:hypothetical protein
LNIRENLNALKERLLCDPKIASFQIRREREATNEGY